MARFVALNLLGCRMRCRSCASAVRWDAERERGTQEINARGSSNLMWRPSGTPGLEDSTFPALPHWVTVWRP